MASTVPTSEPTSARSGDTWKWDKTLSDFPASIWTLTYTLFSASGVESITASADGSVYSIDVAPATTGGYAAGRYDWIAQVTDGTDKHTVGKGVIQVLPDVASESTYDGRTHARIMLDAINATMEGRATAGDLDMVRSSLGGRDLQRGDLIKLRTHYAAMVRQEDDAVALANGQDIGRFIHTRFVG